MKGKNVIIIILLIVISDQVLKFYVKTNFLVEEQHYIIGKWFRLLFVENEGMAYGWKFGGDWGKMVLTLFRFFAVIFGVWYLRDIIRKKHHPGFIICAALIFAGALGNLIDSMFYGIIFDESNPVRLATFMPLQGYAGFLHGKVVDMLYFPIIDTNLPKWVPIWGGNNFLFFSPIFNLADASISTGVIAILLFQKKFFRQQNAAINHPTEETGTIA